MFTEGDTAIKYAEGSRGTHTVDTYKATDPEGVSLTWTKLGNDAEDFDFVNGVLSFRQAPDFEAPVDHNTDNTYEVTLQISDGNSDNNQDWVIRIEVTNVDEDGVVTLTSLNPKEGVLISAVLTDPTAVPQTREPSPTSRISKRPSGSGTGPRPGTALGPRSRRPRRPMGSLQLRQIPRATHQVWTTFECICAPGLVTLMDTVLTLSRTRPPTTTPASRPTSCR